MTARVAGVFYILCIVFGLTGVVCYGKLVVSGDATVVAANILLRPSLLRFDFVANMIADGCYVVVTALFYVIFKPVNRSVSVTAAFFSLIGSGMGVVSCLLDQAPLTLLGGASYLGAFSSVQLHALALLSLKLAGQASNAGIVFFGCYCLMIGYLIYKSTYLPRVLGVLMAFAGLGWLTFLWPPFASHLIPWIMLPGLLGEGSLTVWLLAKGLNAQRWHEQASR